MIELQEARDISRADNFLKIKVLNESETEIGIISKEVVLISGGSSQTGFWLASSLLKNGFRVAALGPIREDLVCLGSLNPNLFLLNFDPGNSEDLRKALDLIVRKWGGIHVLVNIVSLSENKPWGLPTLERTRECLEKFFFLPLKVTLEVLPQMRKQGMGIIHYLVSPLFFAHIGGSFPFSVPQRAIETLSFSLPRGFLGDGVYVDLMLESIFSLWEREDSPKLKETGENLSRAILKRRALIFPDFPTGLFVFLSRRFPLLMGKMVEKLKRISK